MKIRTKSIVYNIRAKINDDDNNNSNNNNNNNNNNNIYPGSPLALAVFSGALQNYATIEVYSISTKI